MNGDNLNLKTINKHNFEICFYNFKQTFKDNNNQDFLNFSSIYHLDNLLIRSTVWKIYLNNLPMKKNNFSEWVKITEERRKVYNNKKKEMTKIKKFKVDPLQNVSKFI